MTISVIVCDDCDMNISEEYALHSFYVVSCMGGLRKICRPEFPGLKIVLCMQMLCRHSNSSIFCQAASMSIKCCEWTLCTFRGRDIASVQDVLLLYTMTHAQFLCMTLCGWGESLGMRIVVCKPCRGIGHCD